MTILVLQLARFGDIFQTWPALRALRRAHPEAEIHLLVRERFRAATEGLDAGVIVHELPTAKFIGPLIESKPSPESALFILEEWIDELASTTWDRIVNLSFSPSSSYLVDLLAGPATAVSGYARHSDGYLAIPDDASAYFYAQVGPGRHNRFHLVDLFAMVAGVDLIESDWTTTKADMASTENSSAAIVHLGASQIEKVYPIESWKRVVTEIARFGHRVILIGSPDERVLGERLGEIPGVDNQIGSTTIPELFPLIRSAAVVVGADSAPVHIAALTGTPVVNLSFDTVSFWETGPISRGSVVIRASTPEILPPKSVVEAVLACLKGAEPPAAAIRARATSVGPRFEAPNAGETDEFCWSLIQALYTQSDFPRVPGDAAIQAAVQRLIDACALAADQFQVLEKNPLTKSANDILSSVDVMLKGITALAPSIAPLVNWFDTERLRIPPGELNGTLKRTSGLFGDLATIARALQRPADPLLDDLKIYGIQRLETLRADLPLCARAFRFFDMADAEPKLQSLLDHLSFFEDNGLHHVGGTKVAVVEEWIQSYDEYREILSRLISAFEKKDYLIVADALEYEIPVCIEQWRTQLVKWQTDMLP